MLRILVAFATFMSAVLADAINGCTPTEITRTGFDVSFYKYPHFGDAFLKDTNFYNGAYKQYGYLTTVTGVDKVNFDSFTVTGTVGYGTIYGYNLTTSELQTGDSDDWETLLDRRGGGANPTQTVTTYWTGSVTSTSTIIGVSTNQYCGDQRATYHNDYLSDQCLTTTTTVIPADGQPTVIVELPSPHPNQNLHPPDTNFYNGAYKQYGYLTTVTGVDKVNFDSFTVTGTVGYGTIYGYNLTTSNFSIAVGGYFLAPQTGQYAFDVYADDGAFIQFGAGATCCGNAIEDVSGDSFKAQWPSRGYANFTLQAGVYYPMKIVLVNWDGPGGLSIAYTGPDGKLVSEIGSQVYQVHQVCATTTTNTWTGQATSTTTFENPSLATVVVEVPTPTQTVTTYWTGSVTSTSTIIGGAGQTNTVVINVPPTTTTTYWTNAYTSTTTVIPADGQPTVIVELPSATPTPNLAPAVNGCSPTEITRTGFDVSFYNFTVTGTVGYGTIYGYNLTTSNFSIAVGGYFLAPQTGQYAFDVYADDGAFIQFGAGATCCGNAIEDVSGDSFKAQWPSRGYANFTLQAGVYYPMKIVLVNWDGPGGLNIAYTGPDGKLVSEIGSQVYQVHQVCATTTTNTWTGQATSTTTFENPSLATVVVEVPTPTQTVTTYWTGSVTSTSTIIGGAGQTNTVVINLPPVTTVSYWTNLYESTTTITPTDGGKPTVVLELPRATTTYVDNNVQGCAPTQVVNNGFDVSFYKYPLFSNAFVADPEFYNGHYKDFGYLNTVTGVNKVNFNSASNNGEVSNNTVYGYEITISNFTMAMGGYFLANQTGVHSFEVFADDGVDFQIGAGNSCCGNALEDVTGETFKTVWPQSAITNLTLQAGVYYPMKLIFVNWNGPAGITIQYTGPDGQSVNEIGSQVYQVRQACTKTTTNTWTGLVTSTATFDESSVVSVVVDVPTPTQTVTSFWTGDHSTASTITGAPGQNNTVVINLPPTTTTTYWNNAYSSTTTITPSDGEQATVVIELPPATITTTWTGSYTTTETTTGTDGGKTVVVDVPGIPTITTTWTGSYTTTETTTGTNGGKTVVVDVPSVPTVTITWTGSYTTTETVTGTDGGKTVVVDVPGIPTITTTWTGSYTTTETTTGTDGGKTVVVDVPGIPTITTTWTGSYTTTETTTGTDGGKTVVVDVPGIPTITTIWTGSYTTTETTTGTNGGKTVVVDVPSVPTVTITWTGSYTTTETVTGTDGGKTVVVDVPGVPTITTTWTGSYTTTETTTGTDGGKTVVVDVPGIPTTTITWTGSYTTTETTTGTNGGKTVVVDVPGVPTITTTWTGSYTTTGNHDWY
ncbi:hypothetical protein JCM33374_g1645 [Metschnikowia sp. JCM 33374]|nr:hypothetical protein JCM33374_g1645 [Metschnikowia sp. JCM 33374]